MVYDSLLDEDSLKRVPQIETFWRWSSSDEPGDEPYDRLPSPSGATRRVEGSGKFPVKSILSIERNTKKFGDRKIQNHSDSITPS